LSGAWLETVAAAQERARRRLPPAVYSALLAGNEGGATLRDNCAAFTEVGLAPRVADSPAVRDLATTIMGMPSSLPVMLAPTGVQAVHPEGECAVARAAASRGVPMGLSSFASRPVEQVVAIHPQVLFQMYWMDTREVMERLLDRVRAAGVTRLILTLDWSFSYGRDWGSPHIPERLTPAAALHFAPQALRRPRWLAAYLRAGTLPDLTVPNLATGTGPVPTFFGAYGRWQQTPPPTWADLAWLVQMWGGPVLVKGICRVDDARRAVDIGATAISVSNHGGNNLDTTPAPLRFLPAVANAVGGQVEVLLDGGVRRGSDVVKALALGARAVMIGRPYLWGLGANGEAGVANVLDILRMGIESTLRGLGRARPGDLTDADVLLPAGFARSAGTDPAGG